ncbi:MAG: hypothetical protein WCE49_14955, partial [Terrimicrobiaceae bacterium]
MKSIHPIALASSLVMYATFRDHIKDKMAVINSADNQYASSIGGEPSAVTSSAASWRWFSSASSKSAWSKKGLEAEWAEVIRGLDNLQQVELLLQGSRFLLRSQLKGDASQALRAAEVALPPALE